MNELLQTATFSLLQQKLCHALSCSQAQWGLGDAALPRKEEQKRENKQNQFQSLLSNGRKSFLAGREAGACVFKTAPVLGMKQQ